MCTEVHAQSSLDKTPAQYSVKQEIVDNELVPNVTNTDNLHT